MLIVRRLAQTVKSRGQELPLERLEAETPARRAPGNALGYLRGDITSQHTADITPDTIIPAGLAGNFDLGQTIWAAFANAQHAEQRRQAHQPQLAA